MGMLDNLLYGSTEGWGQLGTKLKGDYQTQVLDPYNTAVSNRVTEEATNKEKIAQARKAWQQATSDYAKGLDTTLENNYASGLASANQRPTGIDDPSSAYYAMGTGVDPYNYVSNLNPNYTKSNAFANMTPQQQIQYQALVDIETQMNGGFAPEWADTGLTADSYKPKWTFDKSGWETDATTAGKRQWTDKATNNYNKYLTQYGYTPGQVIQQADSMYRIPTVEEYINSLGEYNLYKNPEIRDVNAIYTGKDRNWMPSDGVALNPNTPTDTGGKADPAKGITQSDFDKILTETVEPPPPPPPPPTDQEITDTFYNLNGLYNVYDPSNELTPDQQTQVTLSSSLDQTSPTYGYSEPSTTPIAPAQGITQADFDAILQEILNEPPPAPVVKPKPIRTGSR